VPTNYFVQHTIKDWTNLPRAIKYLIVYEMTEQDMSFVQATRTLNLKLGDSIELVNIVMEENNKWLKYEAKSRLPETMDNVEMEFFDNLVNEAPPHLITDTVTRDEILVGCDLLSFMGLDSIADALTSYEGTTTHFYEVPLNHFTADGPQNLLPHFNVGCSDEIQELARTLQQQGRNNRPVISAGELIVRIDAPTGTINPRRLLPTAARQPIQDPYNLNMGALVGGGFLYPENYQYQENLPNEENPYAAAFRDPAVYAERLEKDDGLDIKPDSEAFEQMNLSDFLDVGEPFTPPRRDKGKELAVSASDDELDEEPFIRRSARRRHPEPMDVDKLDTADPGVAEAEASTGGDTERANPVIVIEDLDDLESPDVLWSFFSGDVTDQLSDQFILHPNYAPHPTPFRYSHISGARYDNSAPFPPEDYQQQRPVAPYQSLAPPQAPGYIPMMYDNHAPELWNASLLLGGQGHGWDMEQSPENRQQSIQAPDIPIDPALLEEDRIRAESATVEPESTEQFEYHADTTMGLVNSGLTPSFMKKMDETIAKSLELMGTANKDQDEEPAKKAKKQLLAAPSQTKKNAGSQGRRVTLAHSDEDVEESEEGSDDESIQNDPVEDDKEWKPPGKEGVRRKQPRPRASRTPVKKSAQAETTPEPPRSSVVVKRARGQAPKATHRTNSTTAPSGSASSATLPQQAPSTSKTAPKKPRSRKSSAVANRAVQNDPTSLFTSSTFAPPSHVPPPGLPPPATTTQTTAAATPGIAPTSGNPQGPSTAPLPNMLTSKRGRGRPRKNQATMPSGSGSTPLGAAAAPLKTPTKASKNKNEASSGTAQASGTAQRPLEAFGFGILPTNMTPQVVQPTPAPATGMGYARLADVPGRVFDALEAEALGLPGPYMGRPQASNNGGNPYFDIQQAAGMGGNASGQSGQASQTAPAPQPSREPLSEGATAALLERKGLLERFEGLRGPGESLRAVVGRMEAQLGLPLELFRLEQAPFAGPTDQRRFAPISPAPVPAPATAPLPAPAQVAASAPRPSVKRGRSTSGSGAEPKRKRPRTLGAAPATPSTPAVPPAPPKAARPAPVVPQRITPVPVPVILAGLPLAPAPATAARPKKIILTTPWRGLGQEGTPIPLTRAQLSVTPEGEEGREDAKPSNEERPPEGGKGPSVIEYLRGTPKKTLGYSDLVDEEEVVEEVKGEGGDEDEEDDE